jgi:vitamin K-dependent gamma-carboxylase
MYTIGVGQNYFAFPLLHNYQRMLERIKAYLSQPTDGRVLGLFRIVFGLFMCYEMVDYIQIDLVRNMFVLPLVNFRYDGFGWLPELPEAGLNAVVYTLLGCALLITLGLLFRWACRLFALGYLYIFLLDKSLYNNHIYLFILVALLLSMTHADDFWSLKRRKKATAVLRWEPFILQAQFAIVYFYAAIIKFKYDWLFRQQPTRAIAEGVAADSWIAPFAKNEAFIYFVTYGGVLIDLLSPILLWYKPVRRVGVPLLAAFHLTNSRLFNDIGIFPFVMLAGLVLFFEANELPYLKRTETLGTNAPRWSQWARNFLLGYFVFQLLFPLRGFVLPNDMDWTTIGNRFAWRVKADNRKVSEMKFEILGHNPGEVAPVNVATFVNTHQVQHMMTDPRSIKDLAACIARSAEAQGYTVARVRASIQVSYNGKPPQYFIKPEANLLEVRYAPLKKLDWVMDESPAR